MAGTGFTLEIKGDKELAKKLKKETITQPVGEGIKKITLFLDREIKMATPVDTGRLRSSVTSQITAEFGKVGTSVQYSSFVEYGTKKMEARHVEGGRRVFGQGMFAYGLQKLQARIGEFLKDIGNAISVGWNK